MFSFSNHSWQCLLNLDLCVNFGGNSGLCQLVQARLSSFSFSLMFQSHESESWAFGGEECGDDYLEELFGLFWVDLLEDPRVGFRVSGTILGLGAGFLSRLWGEFSGVVGVDGVVADGVDGGGLGGAFLWPLFGFPFGGWASLGVLIGVGEGGSLGGWRSPTFFVIDCHHRKSVINYQLWLLGMSVLG